MDGSTIGPASGERVGTGGTAYETRSQLDGATAVAGERIADVKQQAREQAAKARDTVKDEVRSMKDDVERRAADRVNRQKHAVADRMDALVHALDAARGSLEQDGQPQIARFTEDLSRQIERSTGYLRNNDFHGMMRDMEDLARNNSALFLGSSFVAGAAMGRFLRASEPPPEQTDTALRPEGLGTTGDYRTDRTTGIGSVNTGGIGTAGTSGIDDAAATGTGAVGAQVHRGFGSPDLGRSDYLAGERTGSTGFGGPGELGTSEPGGATGTRGAMGAPGEGGLTGDSYDSPRRNREDV